MPKSVHMHVKNFTCIASIMHVKFEVHMHDKIVSHVWKDFTCNKMHGKKVHTYDKNFSHVLQNFTRMSKSSHACEMLMWWTCIFANIDFTWFLFFTHFSHPCHMIFTHIALVVLMDLWSTDILKSTSSLPCLSSISFSSFSSFYFPVSTSRIYIHHSEVYILFQGFLYYRNLQFWRLQY